MIPGGALGQPVEPDLADGRYWVVVATPSGPEWRAAEMVAQVLAGDEPVDWSEVLLCGPAGPELPPQGWYRGRPAG